MDVWMDGSVVCELTLAGCLSVSWLYRSLHSRLRLGGSSSSSLNDLSQAKSPPGVEKGGLDEFGRDKGTQQRRAGTNATWNR